MSSLRAQFKDASEIIVDPATSDAEVHDIYVNGFYKETSLTQYRASHRERVYRQLLASESKHFPALCANVVLAVRDRGIDLDADFVVGDGESRRQLELTLLHAAIASGTPALVAQLLMVGCDPLKRRTSREIRPFPADPDELSADEIQASIAKIRSSIRGPESMSAGELIESLDGTYSVVFDRDDLDAYELAAELMLSSRGEAVENVLLSHRNRSRVLGMLA